MGNEEYGSVKYRISLAGKEDARRLLDGVSPSALGYNFAEAAMILFAFKKSLKDEIKQLENALEGRESILKKTDDLMRKYYDASRLTGEWERIGENQGEGEG